ncbi:MAG: DoxX family protein [Bryobacteraceae bacterium]
MKTKLSGWESQARSVMRIIIGFLILLHGCRNAFGVLEARAGRRGAPPMALDLMGAAGGYVELIGGALLMLGLLTAPVAVVLCLMAAVGYGVGPLFHWSPWPIRNGGEESVTYFILMVYFALAGAGVWSLDALREKKSGAPA